MSLTREQIDKLLQLVSSTQDDSLDCDGCLENIAEFADTQLAHRPLSEVLQSVETHLRSCPCCADEYQALLDALRALEEEHQ